MLLQPLFSGYGKQGPFISPVDSAFVSGVTTKAPSVVGDMDDLDQQLEDYPPPNATIPPGSAHGPVGTVHHPYPSFEQYHEQQALGMLSLKKHILQIVACRFSYHSFIRSKSLVLVKYLARLSRNLYNK